MHRLFTYGYRATGASMADLQTYAAAGALILDIRYWPWTRNREWHTDTLYERLHEETLAVRYMPMRALGNVNYRGGDIQIANLEYGLSELRDCIDAHPAGVVMLCACEDVESCHRSYVAEKALEQMPGLQVVHLRPGQALTEGS